MTNYIERYWRDAKPEDAIKDPPMVARFRSEAGHEWIDKNFNLLGYLRFEAWRSKCLWYNDGDGCYTHCQVYDAPDPGESWWLVDVDSDVPQQGDQYYDACFRVWRNCNAKAKFAKELFYRRRIATPEPKYVPFTWEDREQLRGRMVQLHWENGTKQEFSLHHFTLDPNGRFEIAKVDAEKMLQIGVFLDTGEPVGKKVQ